MFKNYLLTSVRNFRKNTFYLLANIFGLAIAMAICVIGFFNYQYNATFNSYFLNGHNIYKVNADRVGKRSVGSTPAALSPVLVSAGYEAMRYHGSRLTFQIATDNLAQAGHTDLFVESVGFIDPSFLNHFQFSNREGATVQLNGPDAIAITAETAIKWFGHTDVAGQSVNVVYDDQSTAVFRIAHVMEEYPQNISFQFDVLLPIEQYFAKQEIERNSWDHRISGTFLHLDPGQLEGALKTLNATLDGQKDESAGIIISSYQLDNLEKWGAIESDLFEHAFAAHLHPASVMGVVSSAIAILLLACFNYVNTSIAVAGRRLKEVGLRKVFGSSRRQLISQFVLENMLLIIISMLLSVYLLSHLVPAYNALYEVEVVQMAFISWDTIFGLAIGILLLVTILAAAYPALYLSGLSSLKIFREKVTLSGKNIFSKVLLSFQLMLCFYNLFSLFVFLDNATYQEQMDRGYSVDQVINVPLNRPEQYQPLATKVGQLPAVKQYSCTHQLIGFGVKRESLIYDGVDIYPQYLKTGADYLSAMGVELLKGRWFNSIEGSDEATIIINEHFERSVGQDLLNKTVVFKGRPVKVVGVVADFNVSSIMLNNKIGPLVIEKSAAIQNRYLSVVAHDDELQSLDELLKTQWQELYPDQLYGGFFQDKVMKPLRTTNKITLSINTFIVIVSIIISLIGLYTLVSLTAMRRKKEFGVRKVLGSSTISIASQLWKEFRWVLVIAALSGLCAGHFVISNLLDLIFAYHMDVTWPYYLYPVLFMLVALLASIGYKIWKTATINPCDQLRAE